MDLAGAAPPLVPHVVWGLGTGRHLRGLVEGPALLVLAIDLAPDDDVTVAAILAERPELARAVARGTAEIVRGSPDELAGRFRACPPGTRVTVQASALACVPEAARPLARLVERLDAERRGAARFAGLMRANLRANATVLAGAPSLVTVEGVGGDRPVCVVAAGPSASAHLGLVAAIAERGVVVAVDTMLPVLQRAGIRIDCVATVDPHAASAAHLAAGVPNALLALQPYACPELVGAFERHVVAVPRGDLLLERLAARLGWPPVESAGTVLVYALETALRLGRGDVVVVGADFAHVGGRTHAEGTAHGLADVPTSCQLATRRGGTVASTTMLTRFHGATEAFAARAPRLTFVDGGGAQIRTARMVTAEEALRAVRSREQSGGGDLRAQGHPRSEAPARARLLEILAAEFDAEAVGRQHPRGAAP